MNNEEKILNILGQMQSDMKLMQTQLKEHGGILDSLKTSSEFHKADIDNLTHQVVNLSGEIKAGF